jgi:hypothetical protein
MMLAQVVELSPFWSCLLCALRVLCVSAVNIFGRKLTAETQRTPRWRRENKNPTHSILAF